MKIALAGSSGLVGAALVPALRAAGHEVRRLVRRAPRAADENAWDPARGEIDGAALAGVDAVINLAGENIGAGRWTPVRREAIRSSRVDATRTLVAALRAAAPRPRVLINASACGFYGDRGEAWLDEGSAKGRGFLPEVCEAWEGEAGAAEALGVRVVRLRFGLVLAREGGALARMLPLFRAGLGGRLGSGRQWMSWIGRADAVAAIGHALAERRCAGAMNLVAPEPVTNATFAATLGRALRRPAVLPAPAWALRLVFGAMADEALLASTRAEPAQLRATGFVFRHPTLRQALAAEIAAP